MVIAAITLLFPSINVHSHRQNSVAPESALASISATQAATQAATEAANPCTNQPFHTLLTASDILNPGVKLHDATNEYTVVFTLTDDAAARLSDFTAKHIGQQLAVVLDGKILSIVKLAEPTGKDITISAQFTQQSAQAFAAELSSGPLPYPVTKLSQDDIEGGTRLTLQVGNGSPVSADDMNQTQAAMVKRLTVLGIELPDVAFPDGSLANSNNQVIVTLPGAADENSVEVASLAIQSTGLFELVDFSRSESCHAQMPFAGQYILTDVQIARSRPHAPPAGTPGPTVPVGTTSAG